MKKSFFFLISLLIYLSSFAQKEDRNWVFGDSCGIDFNNLTNPVVFHPQSSLYEPCASFSSGDGILKCYNSNKNTFSEPNYGKIINGQGQLMENGDSINQHFSATNGSVFIPDPDDTNKVYFFSINLIPSTNWEKLNFSILDFNYNSGLGKVISKNIIMMDSITEHLVAIKHGNGRDWWIICHKILSNNFIKFLVTPQGIAGPFFQNIGSIFCTYLGESCISRSGDKISLVSGFGNIDIFDFDRCNGDLTNWVEIGTSPYDQPDSSGWTYYGCEFSPDASKMYLSKYKGSPSYSNLVQFNLSSSSIDSEITILPPTPGFVFGQLELAPNDKIYLSCFQGPGTLDTSLKYLSVIETPNDLGVNCNLQLFSFNLFSYKTNGGLPHMPNYNLSALHESECDTIDGIGRVEIKNDALISLYPNPAYDKLVVELRQTQNYINEIEISDALGRVLLKMNKFKRNKIELDIRDLSSGIYFIEIKTGDKLSVNKFFKM